MLGLFSYVLLQVSGDAEQALDLLRELNEEYGLMTTMSMDDFIAALRNKGMVEMDDDGTLRPTAAAERRMRTDALDEIFRSLKKSDIGNHDAPSNGQGVERTPDTRDYAFGD